ncbi:Gfo/Idh/MocA family protein [Foetidibacter luteolus]|uniref:Gfo/Idh/MocA family protein n=1 Tax=Foetidibacter luteolus TaxID=2608880 RepID=UPI00129BB093|nr:Gfo/Idh/MocA family oxidoreductase [Foetidibacter luteolus]
MSDKNAITRKTFLTQTSAAAAGVLLAPLFSNAAAPAAGKKIKVAVIGCGSVSGVYLPHLSKAEYVELVSTCDIKPDRAQKRASEFNVPNHYPHIDQLLAGAPFDLMVNLTNMQEHGRLNKQALMTGKHVWSEKPMANTYKEGRELLDLAISKGLRIWGAPAVVNSPQFAFMAQAINSGKLGKVAAAHAHYGHLGPTWSAFFYEKGGGSLPDLGVYNLATLSGLLGPVKNVIAMTSIVTDTRTVDDKGTIKVEGEDNAMVVMDHGNGILSHVQCGFNYFDPYGHEGKGQDRPTIAIWGTKGNMALVGYDWAPFGVDLAVSFTEKPVRYVEDPGTYVWQQGASVICEALATGKEPLINAEHALHVLEIIEAARESQASGKRIALKSTFKWPVVS